MAKFCGKCGSPLNEQGLCPNCAPAPAAPPAETVPEQSYQPVVPAENTPAPKKKKLPLVPVIIAAAVVVVGALVACAFIFHWFGLGKDGKAGARDSYISTQTQAFMRTSHGKVFGRYNIDQITGDEKNVSSIMVFDLDDNTNIKNISYRMGRDGDTFYGIEGDNNSEWRKVTVTGENTAKREVWVSEDALNNSVLAFEGTYVRDVGYFSVDGDYVYASVVGDAEYFAIHTELNYRIIRADKDGKNIEFVGDEDVRASEFVVRDGWIYYVDNGYRLNGGKISFDIDCAGIYKVKTDGSGKTRIFDKIEKDKVDTSDDTRHNNAGGLTLCGDRLYFCDLSDGSSRLASIDLDGGDYKRCDLSVEVFTLDPGNNKAYCIEGNFDKASPDKHTLYEVDLESGSSKSMELEIRNSRSGMTIDGGYLYICDMSRAFRFEDRGYYRVSLSDFKVQSAEITEMEPRWVEKDEMGFQKEIHNAVYGVHWADLDKGLTL